MEESEQLDIEELLGRFRPQIVADLSERPGSSLNDYFTQLEECGKPGAMRTAVFLMIASGEISNDYRNHYSLTVNGPQE